MIVSYSLTPIEEAICVEVGYQRQKPFFGDPTKNVNYAEGDLWEMWQHVVAAGSELAFARIMGDLEYTPDFNTFKSKLDIPGWGEIRYSYAVNAKLRFTNRDNPELKYALMTKGLAVKPEKQTPSEYRSTPYEAIGWIYGAEAMLNEYQFNDTTWYVPKKDLRPMETI